MRCDNLLGESERWVDRYGMCHASLLCQSHMLLREDTITECEGFLCAQKQLSCRILVKVIPHSVSLISSSEEGGGGNRISEDQIKSYLDEALGEGPRPLWGLPGGWGDYCSSKSNAGHAHNIYISHPSKNGLAACIAPCRAKLLLLCICSNAQQQQQSVKLCAHQRQQSVKLCAHQRQQSVKLCALPLHNTGGCLGLEHLQQELSHNPFCHHSSGPGDTS
jgi:hypothetical protein